MMPLLDLCEPEELDVNADDGFERFLEALACDDTCTTIPVYPDTVPRFNAQHEASQPAKKSLNKCIGVRFVPADQETEKMPDHATVNHVSALQDLSALPTAQEVKLEKLREKNRRTQKAFRVRQKVRVCTYVMCSVYSASVHVYLVTGLHGFCNTKLFFIQFATFITYVYERLGRLHSSSHNMRISIALRNLRKFQPKLESPERQFRTGRQGCCVYRNAVKSLNLQYNLPHRIWRRPEPDGGS